MSNQPQVPDDDKLLEDYEAFVKYFNEEKIPLRTCICFNRRIKYFTTADAFKAFKDHKEVIPQLLKNVNYNTHLETDQDVKDFIANILLNMVVLKLCWKGDDRSQYPTELGISKDQKNYEDNAFYGWVIVGDTKPNFFRSITLIFIPSILLLFVVTNVTIRLWFYYFFVGIFFFCVQISLMVLKFLCHYLFTIIDKDVVILPNLLEEVPFTHLLRPAIAVYKLDPVKDRKRKMVTIAILLLITILAIVRPDILNHFLSAIFNFIKRSIAAGEFALTPTPKTQTNIPNMGKTGENNEF